MSTKHLTILLGLLAAIGPATRARAQYDVYAAEFNQSNNGFGTLNLLTGNFTQISSLGGALINDIAYSPTSGTLLGIQNSSTLLSFNTTTGGMTTLGTLSVSGLESIAFRPSDGLLFGATQSALYTIDPATGQATLVGNYGAAYNLGNNGQNIRFNSDGNLYLSNTSADTDIYRINTQTGSAMLVGQVFGVPNLVLENGGNYMYGVSVAVGAPGGTQPELLSFDLNSFVDGGTNSDGSIHNIGVTMVGAGANMLVNFNFSGQVDAPVAAVPEPSTTAMILMGCGALVLIQSRRYLRVRAVR